MKCDYCEAPVQPGQLECSGCGASLPQTAPVQQQQGVNPQMQTGGPTVIVKKSVFMAQLLSCFFPGVGQMYNGQVTKGIVLLLAHVLIASATAGVTAIITWIIAIVDAGNIAKKINQGNSVRDWEWF